MFAESLISENTAVSIGLVIVIVGLVTSPLVAAFKINRSIGRLKVSVDGLRKDMKRVGRRIDRRLTRSDFISWLTQFKLMNPDIPTPELPTNGQHDQPDDDNDGNDSDEEEGF